MGRTMPLFRKLAPEEPLVVSMSGARLGLRVLIVVGDDAELPLDVAAKVGLSGQTVVLADSEGAAARVTGRAERRGVFVETAPVSLPLPFADEAFDLVTADDRRQPLGSRIPPAMQAEAHRVLRAGGRLVVLRPAPHRWVLLSRAGREDPGGLAELTEQLTRAGFRAVREIATRDRIAFVEAARANQ